MTLMRKETYFSLSSFTKKLNSVKILQCSRLISVLSKIRKKHLWRSCFFLDVLVTLFTKISVIYLKYFLYLIDNVQTVVLTYPTGPVNVVSIHKNREIYKINLSYIIYYSSVLNWRKKWSLEARYNS